MSILFQKEHKARLYLHSAISERSKLQYRIEKDRLKEDEFYPSTVIVNL